jgi:endonuclease/exonuclease/phosphatase family metal-dependent hydrolase
MASREPARESSPSSLSGEPPFEPVGLNRPALVGRSPLKVALLNVAGGREIRAIADRLSRPPLSDAGSIMLCEASWRMPRHGLVEAASTLAEALKMSFAFLPSFGRPEDVGNYRATGNALLSAQPIEDFFAVPLAKPPHLVQPRRVIGVHQGLIATLAHGGRRFRIGVVHLERLWDPAGRAQQMEDFLAAIGRDLPAIIGGDLNTTTLNMDRRLELPRACLAVAIRPRRFRYPERHEPLFESISTHGFSIEGANVRGAPTFTMGGIVPRLWRPKLDWIAARGLNPVSGTAAVVPARNSRLGRRLSDHEFVTCEFRF